VLTSLAAALFYSTRGLQFGSTKRRCAERRILRANFRDVVQHFTVPFEPGMRLKFTLAVTARADPYVSCYAPASQQAPKYNRARKATNAERIPPASDSHHLCCAPDICSRLFCQDHWPERIFCEPQLRLSQANRFQARGDDGQEKHRPYYQGSIALRKAVPRFGLTPQ
jgi:hypothetical protein